MEALSFEDCLRRHQLAAHHALIDTAVHLPAFMVLKLANFCDFLEAEVACLLINLLFGFSCLVAVRLNLVLLGHRLFHLESQ